MEQGRDPVGLAEVLDHKEHRLTGTFGWIFLVSDEDDELCVLY